MPPIPIETLVSEIEAGEFNNSLDFFTRYPDHKITREAQFKIMCESLLPTANENSTKTIICIGGGPASGKSTLKHTIKDICRANNIPAVFFANEDIQNYIPEVAALRAQQKSGKIPNVNLSKFFEKETEKIRVELINEASKQGLLIVVEAHLNSALQAQTLLSPLQSKNYNSILIQPDVSFSTCLARGKKREESTGKPLSVNIIANQIKFEKNWLRYIKLFNVAIRLDNEQDNIPPKPFAIALNGKLHIMDEERYERARKKSSFEPEQDEEIIAAGGHVTYGSYESTAEEMGRSNKGDVTEILKDGFSSILASQFSGQTQR